jgi:hypothetical protein
MRMKPVMKKIVGAVGVIASALTFVVLPQTAALAAQDRDTVRIEIPDDVLFRVAEDLSGSMPSAYRGEFFYKDQESLRKCILGRESSARYTAVSATGKYRGAYQLSPEMWQGVTWMLIAEHAEHWGRSDTREMLKRLRSLPVNKWNRYWQDAAFYTVLNWEYKGSGASHWDSTRFNC